MKNNKFILTGFVIVAIAQLFVPVNMIVNNHLILSKGVELKFETAPVDPVDPFMGRYVLLQYNENKVKVDNERDWKPGQKIFVILTGNSEGFAQCSSASKERPDGQMLYVKARVDHVSTDGSNTLTIYYPFDRFYMEETKAPEADSLYRHAHSDSTQTGWALVAIREGDAVLKDVFIGGSSLKELIEQRRQDRSHLE